ncbi:TrmB family transcriptional regulator [Promethearchaeum syntrophicum]|uniref:TrmB family transcriptional regulator n=1 Tax=Promethearchaeum syntrophicum TaxID=2594042 RepID=A0A5B9D8E0_9ARCH|nr:helix-turn-helix domain-containing protein [Candidatus Prometheoarchaeum syntrophicum]QEE15429.1 Sugar-specific transcriptional regulator TrmB [Candidatus Prometheoarchaeum syntrophicum]
MSTNISQEVYAALKEFGLTDYETRAFIALITNGISSAKELSDRTKIPYSRIYDVLVNLENIGFVNVISGRPMKYQAERPAYVAKLAKKQIEEKYQRIEYALLEKLEPLYGHEENIESTPIWILNGDVNKKINEMIRNSQKTLTIFLHIPKEEMLEEYFESFLFLTEKKVDINIIVDQNYLKIKNKNIWRKLTSVAKIQVINNVLFDGFLFDYDEMVMFLTTFFKLSIKEEDMVFLIQESRLINYTKTYFKMIWSMGEKFLLKNYS